MVTKVGFRLRLRPDFVRLTRRLKSHPERPPYEERCRKDRRQPYRPLQRGR
ncbi:MAG: hypothetical protein AVDCRST_MAG28-3420 [uncultured Rubrobacteraceae bacterium]|uniref:Uncharacterized protein n=1 Tax=uncultured Rubrobacteraceae bacterium TaxID=349277 RepID=A0A6J4R5B2_9ACTN|nr:MAG: hypothetical protein AVDCRST_MAG28-3420 [uncultured Rubrobacteraceae bacterium]